MQACSHPEAQRTPLFPAQDYITGDRFVIARCGACGFTVTTPQPRPEAMGRYYPAGYYGSAGGKRFPKVMERLQDALYGHRAETVQKLNRGRPGRVLDVGCGRGLLLEQFRRRGWEGQGTELSEQAAAYPRDVLKLPVRIGTLDNLEFPAGHFDAVVMWHVLEHVSDPRVALAAVARVLKPGGIFMVGVPNFGGLEARSCRDKWFHLDAPRHLTHFTWSALREGLAAAGLHERQASGFAPEYDCFSFVQSLLSRAGLRHNLLYNVLRGRGAKVLSANEAGRLQIALTLLLAAPLGMLSVPATLLLGLFRQGATMTVWAEKK